LCGVRPLGLVVLTARNAGPTLRVMDKVAAWHTEVPHAMWSGQTTHGIRDTTAGPHATGGMRRCGAGRAPAAILHGCCVLHVVGCTACGTRANAPLRRTGRCETSVRQHATHKYATHNVEHTTQNACAKKKGARSPVLNWCDVPRATCPSMHTSARGRCASVNTGATCSATLQYAAQHAPVQHAAQRYNIQRNTPGATCSAHHASCIMRPL
jgi:hypothetical protein